MANSETVTLHKEGFLNKAGKHPFQGFKKRWFVLNGTVVKYYPTQDQSESNTLGVIDMTQVTILGMSRSVKYGFEMSTRARTYFLAAKSNEERESWMEAFQAAMKIACDKELEKSALASLEETGTPFGQNPLGLSANSPTSIHDKSQDHLYETVEGDIGDIEKIMAEATILSEKENVNSEEAKRFKAEVVQGSNVQLAERSPKFERQIPRLSNVMEDEVEEDGCEQAGVKKLLSQMSLDSLDSIDSEDLLLSSDEDSATESLGKGTDKKSDICEISRDLPNRDELVGKAVDVVDGDFGQSTEHSGLQFTAMDKIKEALNTENCRFSGTLQEMQKIYNFDVAKECEFPAYELLKKVLDADK